MRGYITVLFAIALTLCMSLILTVFVGVSGEASRSRVEESASTSIYSIYGEYQRELWGIYNMTFVDAGYSHKAESLVLPEEHMKMFMNKNFDEGGFLLLDGTDLLGLNCYAVESEGVRFATDDSGAAIKFQAVEYMKYKYKISYIESLYEIVSEYERNEMEESEYGEMYDTSKASTNNADIAESYELSKLEELSKDAILSEEDPSLLLTLKVVLGSIDELSKEKLNQEALVSGRNKNTGNIPSYYEESFTNKTLFREYALRKTNNYISKGDAIGLAFETEYLIAGRMSDLENLESVFNRILLIREANNLITLTNDSTKMNEIEILAATLATLIAIPEAAEAFKAMIVVLWSYIESVNDLKELVSGKEVSFLKEAGEWQTDFINISGKTDISNSSKGMTYEDYLRLLLYLTKTEDVSNRLMDLMETNVRIASGNTNFRLDYCFDAWKLKAYVSGKGNADYNISRIKDLEK